MAEHVDRHFAGRISPRGERALREHLPACEACRRRYERHLLLAELDPQALGSEERLGRGLGLRPGRRGLALGPVLTLAAAGAACAALLWFALPGRLPGGFTARGGRPDGAEVELLVYRVQAGRPPQPVAEAIGPQDELAFAYRNPGGLGRLLVFGVDEHGHVYWYHPAWTDPQASPLAVPIARGAEPRELPEAVSHALDGAELRLFGVFTDRPVGVREVEEHVRRAGPRAAALGLPGAVEATRLLQVKR